MNVICNACNQEIYEVIGDLVSGTVADSNQFKSLNPSLYQDPTWGTPMDCPKCFNPWPAFDRGLHVLTTEGLKP